MRGETAGSKSDKKEEDCAPSMNQSRLMMKLRHCNKFIFLPIVRLNTHLYDNYLYIFSYF